MTFSPKTLADKLGLTSDAEPLSAPGIPPDGSKPAVEPKMEAETDAPGQKPVLAPAPLQT